MTLVPLSDAGIATVAQVLGTGDAVVLPCPSPLPYVVAARSPQSVNGAKGRPRGQPCGRLVEPGDVAFSHLDLNEDARDFAEWAAAVELVSLLVPVTHAAPAWLRSGAPHRFAGLSAAWHPGLHPLVEQSRHLSISSANRTARPPAVTAQEAEKAFAGRLLVLDGDGVRDRTRDHGSAVMLQILRTGTASVVRNGVQNRGCADDREYLRRLRRRFRAHRSEVRADEASTTEAAEAPR